MSEEKQFRNIALENGIFETRLTRKFSLRKPYNKLDPGCVKAVIPGVVSEILTKAGNEVKPGETLIVLEAMKMLNRIVAPIEGKVKIIHVSKGAKAVKGQVLLEIESSALLIKEIRPKPSKPLY